MNWKGETSEQYDRRAELGIEVMAICPTQMLDGSWVWLEKYWASLHRGPNGRSWWVRAINRDDCVPKHRIRPPAPTATVTS